MPVTKEQLTEEPWWFRSDSGNTIVRLTKGHRGNWVIQQFGVWELVEHIDAEILERLIAPVAPYREKNTLVVMGWLGNKSAYLNVPKEEAIARFKKDNEGDDEPYSVNEYEFTDELWAYDVSGPF